MPCGFVPNGKARESCVITRKIMRILCLRVFPVPSVQGIFFVDENQNEMPLRISNGSFLEKVTERETGGRKWKQELV